MNSSHISDDRIKIIGTRAKALAFVFVVGSVALTTQRMLAVPFESSPATRPPAAMATGVSAAAVAATIYPALAGDAAQDEDGHPSSF